MTECWQLNFRKVRLKVISCVHELTECTARNKMLKTTRKKGRQLTVPDQNGISQLCSMLEIYHSGPGTLKIVIPLCLLVVHCPSFGSPPVLKKSRAHAFPVWEGLRIPAQKLKFVAMQSQFSKYMLCELRRDEKSKLSQLAWQSVKLTPLLWLCF